MPVEGVPTSTVVMLGETERGAVAPRAQWRQGALQGATEKAAFFVRCDRTTMTQSDIDAGRLVCLIGIAPVSPRSS